MVTVFERDAAAFDTNGLGPVNPISCVVAETLNGQWELTLEHAWDGLKSARLQIGNIIRAPVPAGYTPSVERPTSEDKEIWAVSDAVTSSLYLWPKQPTEYPVRYLTAIWSYRAKTEVVVLSKEGDPWYEVTGPDGKHGWMYRHMMRYVRTEHTPGDAEEEVKEPMALRDQLFRIYRIEPGLTTFVVKARHIFYDLMCNVLDELKPENAIGAVVAQAILDHCQGAHGFTMYSNLTTTESADFTYHNPVDAMLNESSGLCALWHGELARDWWDIYAVKRVGRDTDIVIRQGKNMTHLTGEIDNTNVATRIIPIGRTSGGDPLYLPGDKNYVWNETADPEDLRPPRYRVLDKPDIKVGGGVSEQEAIQKLRDAAAEEFTKGCDEPEYTLEVDFVDLGDTVEYADYGILYDLSMGDSVRVVSEAAGVDERMRLTEYEYDCLAKRYRVMKLEKKKSFWDDEAAAQ